MVRLVLMRPSRVSLLVQLCFPCSCRLPNTTQRVQPPSKDFDPLIQARVWQVYSITFRHLRGSVRVVHARIFTRGSQREHTEFYVLDLAP